MHLPSPESTERARTAFHFSSDHYFLLEVLEYLRIFAVVLTIVVVSHSGVVPSGDEIGFVVVANRHVIRGSSRIYYRCALGVEGL